MKLLQVSAPAGSLRDRVRAFAIHLGISLAVAAAAAIVVFGLWFPQPYGDLVGGTRIFLLLILIDVIIGPCCTFAVFNRHKSGLKFDLTVIALLQVSALAYGMHVAANSRIVFLVLEEGMLYVTPATLIEPQDLEKASRPEFKTLSWTGPVLAAAPRPDNSDDSLFVVRSSASGKGINGYPKFYRPYDEFAPELMRKAKTIDRLLEGPSGDLVRSELQRLNVAADQVRFVAVRGREAEFDKTALLSLADGEILSVIDIDPWS